ncbi:hypothetical protein QT996_00605 [Microcoleus sp. S13C4]
MQFPDCFSPANKARISGSRFVSGFSKTSDFDPTFTGSGLVKIAPFAAVAGLYHHEARAATDRIAKTQVSAAIALRQYH